MKKFLISTAVLLALVLVPMAAASKNNTNTIVLTEDNLLVLSGEVNGDSVGKIIKQAKDLDAKLAGKLGRDHTTPLYLYLNSPGGSITSGLELIEALNGLGRPIHPVTAFAASMAFQISENLDIRYILKNGILMSHRAAGGFQGSFGGTAPSQLDNRYHLWLQITKEMDQQVVDRTNGKQTMDSYQKAYANEMWLTGQESIAGGYADQITKVKCGKGLEGTTEHEANFMGMTVTYETDNCPINTSPMNAKIAPMPGTNQEYINLVLSQFLTSYGMNAQKPLPMVM